MNFMKLFNASKIIKKRWFEILRLCLKKFKAVMVKVMHRDGLINCITIDVPLLPTRVSLWAPYGPIMLLKCYFRLIVCEIMRCEWNYRLLIKFSVTFIAYEEMFVKFTVLTKISGWHLIIFAKIGIPILLQSNISKHSEYLSRNINTSDLLKHAVSTPKRKTNSLVP
jgi:hypothetical protein